MHPVDYIKCVVHLVRIHTYICMYVLCRMFWAPKFALLLRAEHCDAIREVQWWIVLVHVCFVRVRLPQSFKLAKTVQFATCLLPTSTYVCCSHLQVWSDMYCTHCTYTHSIEDWRPHTGREENGNWSEMQTLVVNQSRTSGCLVTSEHYRPSAANEEWYSPKGLLTEWLVHRGTYICTYHFWLLCIFNSS